MTTALVKKEELKPYDLVRVSTLARLPSDWGQPGVAVTTEEMAIELLHRPSPKPPVGTVLTGRQVKSRPWKRGTVLICTKDTGDENLELKLFELNAHGQWVIPKDGHLYYELYDDDIFVLIRRPEEESDRSADG